MIIGGPTADFAYTVLYIFALFSNVLFIFYLIIQRLKTSIDRLIFSLSVAQLLLVVLGIPFVYDVWVGEPYKYGVSACSGVMPLNNILDFFEALMHAMLAVFVAEKLRGDHEIKWRVLGFFTLIQLFCIVFLLPTFGVWALFPRSGSEDSETLICTETWNRNSKTLHRVSQALQLLVPLGVAVKYLVKAHRVIKFMVTQMNNKKSNARYQSFGKIISNSEASPDSNLCFGESEEMNLEMGHLYHKGDITSTASKDEPDSPKQAHVFTSEIEIDQIDSTSPLWRGRPKAGEYQKTILSVHWFRYAQNLYHVFLFSTVVHAILCLPSLIFRLYSATSSTYEFTETERTVAKTVLWLRYLACAIQPWIFVFGVTKYRKNLFGKCCQPKRNVLFPKSSEDVSSSIVNTIDL